MRSLSRRARFEHRRGAVTADAAQLAERIRATLQVIQPDHITPIGVRLIEHVLDDALSTPPGRQADQ